MKDITKGFGKQKGNVKRNTGKPVGGPPPRAMPNRDAEIMAHWQTLVENRDERAMSLLNSPFMKQLIKVLYKHLSKP